MKEFKNTKRFETVFGTVETEYVADSVEPPTIFNGMVAKALPSHYRAIVLDGKWNGWGSTGVNRDNAVAALLSEIAARYAHDLVGPC